jgi:hypothetical protein
MREAEMQGKKHFKVHGIAESMTSKMILYECCKGIKWKELDESNVLLNLVKHSDEHQVLS